MSEHRLIDAELLAWSFLSAAEHLESENKTLVSRTMHCIGEMIESGELGITVDAVPREEFESLLKRFRHLLESDYIRSFDEVECGTGKYKRDIEEADRENRCGRWINESLGYRNCSECGCEHPIQDAKGYYIDDNYCPECGAKMKRCESDV